MIEIIAEIGQNHNGDMNLAEELIRVAKLYGADVVKFQLYEAKRLFSKDNNPWYEYNLQTEISKEQLFRLYEISKRYEVEFMASVFDEERIEWLEEIGVKRYKLASRSIYDNNLIDKISKTEKETLVSLGYWNKKELPKLPFKKSRYLYCISSYPAQLYNYNFNEIDFSIYDGLSDHSITLTPAFMAISRGAKIIEKHFTLNKGMYGPDHACSMIPDELEQLVRFSKEAQECLM